MSKYSRLWEAVKEDWKTIKEVWNHWAFGIEPDHD